MAYLRHKSSLPGLLHIQLLFQRESFNDGRITLLFLVIAENKNALNYVYDACVVHTVMIHTHWVHRQHTNASKFLLHQLSHTHKPTWQLCQEASSRSIPLYSFICFVTKANFWKLTLAVTSICFCHLWAMQIKRMNIQTGLSAEAQVLRLAYGWWRIMWTSETGWKKKESKSSYPYTLPPPPSFLFQFKWAYVKWKLC